MVHFVGAGSGAVDLITVRGARLLAEADVVIYAGSLVNPEVLSYTSEGCRIYNSAEMTLEQVLEVIRSAEDQGKNTVRLHTGDSSIYGAVREQFDELDELGIATMLPRCQRLCGRRLPAGGVYLRREPDLIITRARADTGAGGESIRSWLPTGPPCAVFRHRA